MNRFIMMVSAVFLLAFSNLQAAQYQLDTQGTHAFIQFKIKHLGYSWLWGRFNKFNGSFTYDEAHPENSKVTIEIDTKSLDTNHAERDKHLRDERFFDVKKYPKASFVSTSYIEGEGDKATLKGKLTLHGITKEVSLEVEHIGHGKDPWGGYRRGFAASTVITLSDFGMNYNLGPAAKQAEIIISVEGIRQ